MTGVFSMQQLNWSRFNLLSIDATSGNSRYQQTFSSAEEAILAFQGSKIETFLPDYNSNAVANATINFRGINIFTSYSANSSALTVSIPDIGFNKTFAGSNRDASVDLLKDFLKKDGGSVVNQLMKAFFLFRRDN